MSKPALPLPSQETLLRLFRYVDETGELFWTHDPEVPPRVRGKPALASRGSNAYAFGAWKGQRLGRGRVIWKMFNGSDPIEIDHIDRDCRNDRISNLRSVSHRVNCRNRGLYSTNTSGVTGVTYCKRAKRWLAHIHIAGKMKNLGLHPTKVAAIRARQSAEKENGYD